MQVRPGPLRIRATPKFPSYVLPFETVVEIEEHREPIVLRGTSLGGHLRLETHLAGGAKRVGYARLVDSNQRALHVVAVDGSRVFTRTPLPPGRYQWSLGASGHRPATIPMVAEPGTTTVDQVFLKAE